MAPIPSIPDPGIQTVTSMEVPLSEYDALQAQAVNYRTIIHALLSKPEFQAYIRENGRILPNLVLTPTDETGGRSVVGFLDVLTNNYSKLKEGLLILEQRLIVLEQAKRAIPTQKAPNLPKKPTILERITRFIFV